MDPVLSSPCGCDRPAGHDGTRQASAVCRSRTRGPHSLSRSLVRSLTWRTITTSPARAMDYSGDSVASRCKGVVANTVRPRICTIFIGCGVQAEALLALVRGMRANRQRQPAGIHDRKNVNALTTHNLTDLHACAIRRGERGVNSAFALVDFAFLARRNGQRGKKSREPPRARTAAKCVDAPSIVGIVLARRKHIPLCPCVQDPQHHLEHLARQGPLTSCAPEKLLRGKMHPSPF